MFDSLFLEYTIQYRVAFQQILPPGVITKEQTCSISNITINAY
jgi:hypothetical protein